MSEETNEIVADFIALLDDDANLRSARGTLIEFLEEAGNRDGGSWLNCGGDDVLYRYDGGAIELELVHSEGGSEGEGEHVERVVKVLHNGKERYLRFTGAYYSYDGTTMNDDATLVNRVLVVQPVYGDERELSNLTDVTGTFKAHHHLAKLLNA